MSSQLYNKPLLRERLAREQSLGSADFRFSIFEWEHSRLACDNWRSYGSRKAAKSAKGLFDYDHDHPPSLFELRRDRSSFAKATEDRRSTNGDAGHPRFHLPPRQPVTTCKALFLADLAVIMLHLVL